MKMPTVALVGRPNVGKSTIFNRLVGKKVSIIEDTPGVTRDRIYGDVSYNDYKFHLIDTGGIDVSNEDFNKEIIIQATLAIDEADVIVFIVDGKVFGTLKYVTGYTGFSGRADEQEGYYLALHYECEGADSIKVNGVTLDEDGLHILIIKKMGGKVKVEVSKDEDTYSEYIDISALKYE